MMKKLFYGISLSFLMLSSARIEAYSTIASESNSKSDSMYIYEYGNIFNDNNRHPWEEIFPLNLPPKTEYLYAYDNSEEESEQRKLKHKVSVDLSITRIESHINANLIIKNNSKRKLYIAKVHLPHLMQKDFFNIIADKIILERHGNHALDLDMPDDFLVIQPSKEFSANMNLDEFYHFLPGRHVYDIGSFDIPMHDHYVNYDMDSGDFFKHEFFVRSNRVKIEIDSLKLNKTFYGESCAYRRINTQGNTESVEECQARIDAENKQYNVRPDRRAVKGAVLEISGQSSPYSGLWEPLTGVSVLPIKIAKGEVIPQWKDDKGVYDIEWILVLRDDGGPVVLPELYP